MAKKSGLSVIVDQLGDLLSIIKDKKTELSSSKPVLESLQAYEQQVKVIGDFIASLPKADPSPEDEKALSKLEKIRTDGEAYLRSVEHAMEKQKTSGKAKQTDSEKKRTQRRRQRKFDSIDRL